MQWRWFSKNTMDQHQQMTLHPKSSQTVKLNTGLQETWAMSFSTLPPDSRTLVSKWNTKLALIWKEDFGPLGNSPVLLLLSPDKTPLTTTVAKFLDTSVCGGSWCLDPSLFYWNKLPFPRHSNLLRCTCILYYIFIIYYDMNNNNVNKKGKSVYLSVCSHLFHD